MYTTISVPPVETQKETIVQTPQEASITEQQLNSLQAKLKLENQLKSGASWFYWIAGLSMLNTLLLIIGAKLSLLMGLGVTQLIDALGIAIVSQVGPTTGMIVRVLAFLVNLAIASVFVLCGVFARKRQLSAFILGMVLYALDVLILLVFQEWLSFGFHLWALYGLYSGLQAKQKLAELESSPSFPSAA